MLGFASLLMLCAGCGGSGASQQAAPTVTPTAGRSPSATPPESVVARDMSVLRAREYVPDRHITTTLPDGSTLYVFHSVCAGSIDGHCQGVHAFRGSEARVIWWRHYTGVLALQPSAAGFTVRAVNYAAQDPLCCPSLPPVVDTYTWSGQGFRETGALPRSPGG